ncbi:MAG: SIS domain-containing protein [Abditibacteriota bacterium]|nr:SIS domain-containing protein [Abditibacteriota bacterium]
MIEKLLSEHKELEYLRENIKKTVEAIKTAYNKGGKVMVCGNGGSCADADHIVGELMKGFLSKRPLTSYEEGLILNQKYDNADYLTKFLQRGIPAISLNTHGALISAVINDIGADMMFAQQVFSIGTECDVLIGISTGGGAENVINALKVARAIGCTTVGMTGNRQGKMNEFCDILLDAPSPETYRIQEYHIAIYHALCAQVEKEIFQN